MNAGFSRCKRESQEMDDEVAEYERQMELIDVEIAQCSDEERKSDLLQTRSELVELLALLREEHALRDDQHETSTDMKEEGEEQDEEEDEEEEGEEGLIGQRCRAPYPSPFLTHHNAVILDVVASRAPGDPDQVPRQNPSRSLQVVVLFLNPMSDAMRPCRFFLNERCTYGAQCRFSHGHVVAFDELLEYDEPQFELLPVDDRDCLMFRDVKEGSAVLVLAEERDDGLWQLGRVSAIEGTQLAVKLVATQKEVKSVLDRVFPVVHLHLPDYDSGESSSSLPLATDQSMVTYAIGDIGDWEHHTRGVGSKLMARMGYKLGQGLGKDSQGIVQAIQPRVFPKGKSVDVCMASAKLNAVKKTTGSIAKRKTKMLTGIEPDIFAFINRLHSKTPTSKEKAVDLKQSSSKELAIQRLNLETELLDARKKVAKYAEGRQRNAKRDPVTAGKLHIAQEHAQSELANVQRRYDRVVRELAVRDSARKANF